MSICRSLLGIVLARAEQHRVSRVVEVNVEVGELRGIVPEHLRYYFDLLKKGTLAEAATLNVTTVPGEAECLQCEARFPLAVGSVTCPDCASPDAEVVAGQELRVMTLRVD